MSKSFTQIDPVELFNEDPVKAINYLIENEIFENNPQNILEFILKTNGLDRGKIGEYFAKHEQSKETFDLYLKNFDFTGELLDFSLRKFLYHVFLPDESHLMDFLIEGFSKHYYSQNEGGDVFANEDSVFILSFSIIMLNTDLHNDNIIYKLTKVNWVTNNVGINAGADIPKQYMEEMYDRIKNREIILNKVDNSEIDYIQTLIESNQEIEPEEIQKIIDTCPRDCLDENCADLFNSAISSKKRNKKDIVELLINNNLDVNKSSKIMKITPLHKSIMIKNDKIIKLLIENKADPTLKNKKGKTALELYKTLYPDDEELYNIIWNSMTQEQQEQYQNNNNNYCNIS